MSLTVKILHVFDMLSNVICNTLNIYWSKGEIYTSSSILVKYDYLLEGAFIVNWRVAKIIAAIHF